MEEESTHEVLRTLRDTLNRTQIGAVELLQKFRSEAAQRSDRCTEHDFRRGLRDLGLEVSDERYDVLLKVLEKDEQGNILLKKLETRLTRTSTKSQVKSVEWQSQEKESKDDSMMEGSRQTTKTFHHGDWLPSEDHHGCLTERERRMNSHRKKPKQLAPMTSSDVIMAKIKGVLNRRKIRSAEIFRFLDINGNGAISASELSRGLQRLGVHTLNPSELKELIMTLDADGSGDIDLQEFDKAIRLAEKKARFEGREDLVDTWKVPEELMLDFGQKYDWSKRTLKFDGKYTGEEVSVAGTGGLVADASHIASRSDVLVDQSWESEVEDPETSQFIGSSTSRSKPSTLLNAGSHRWMQASTGPLGAALSAPVGSGNLHDNFIFRQRLVDNTWASRPPRIERAERLPLYRYGRFSRAIAETRWGAEPVQVPELMLKTREGCLTASRPRRLADLDRGREKFNAPLLKSVIDTVVFGHDLDFSNDRSSNDAFKAKFEGAYGKASWFTEEEDLGSGLFRQALV